MFLLICDDTYTIIVCPSQMVGVTDKMNLFRDFFSAMVCILMLFLRVISFLGICLIIQLTCAEALWAWGPAIHTAVSCRILDEVSHILPLVAHIIQRYPLEYIYGSLAADFFVGKGQKKKEGHPHNWETGFRMLDEAIDDREAGYAYGFLSHLAADVIAHNYFVPNLIHQASTLKRVGHIVWEARADHLVGAVYTRLAKDVLSTERLGCDSLLKLVAGKRGNGLKARRHIYTQTVKLSDYLCGSQPVSMASKMSRYRISHQYLAFMISLSYRLVKDFLSRPHCSPCLSYDPIGSRNLRLASRNAMLSKLFNIPRTKRQFLVDQDLLNL